MHEEFITTENGRLYTRVSGCGKPVFMIHGVATDAEYFKDVETDLSDFYMIQVYDRNGHSRSTPFGDADFSIHGETKDALAVLDAFFDDRVTLVGVSAGASIALEIALAHPERTDRLILYEPAFCFTDESVLRVEHFKKKILGMAEEGRTAAALLCFVDMIGGLDSESPPVSDQQQINNYNNFKFYLNQQLKHLCYGRQYIDKLKKLMELELACHVLVGTEEQNGLFCQTGIETAGLLDVEPLYVRGYHNYPKDHPEDFAAIIRRLMG